MSAKPELRWFTDDGPGLDRFGYVLFLSILSVVLLSLIDMDDAAAGIRSGIGWMVVTLTVSATLIATLRASGLAKRARRVIEVLILVGVVGVSALVVANWSTGGAAIPGLETGQPSLLWTVLAVISPVLVLRRVMKQRTVTLAALYGAVASYLLVALAFNYAFLGVDNVIGSVPFFGQVESSSSFMYFSLATITTVGYGDLAAVSDLGRFLSSAEAVIGQVLLVTVVARLVSLYSRSPGRIESSEGQETLRP